MTSWRVSSSQQRNVIIKFLIILSFEKLFLTQAANSGSSIFVQPGFVPRGGSQKLKMSTNQTDLPKDSTPILGGGSINEKQRGRNVSVSHTTDGSSRFDPCNNRAHLGHALEGMERYPSYLSRWQTEDMDRLEVALEAQLLKVQEQKRSTLHRRDGISQLIQTMLSEDTTGRSILNQPETWEELAANVLDPRAAKAILKSKQFKVARTRPALNDVLSGQVPVELDLTQLQDLLDQEMFDVYSMPVLSQEFCIKLKGFVQQVFLLGGREQFRHLHLGRRPVDLDTVGLGWVTDLLFHLIMRPIAKLLFKDGEGVDDLDWRQGYVAGYSAVPSSETGTTRHRLVPHTDDSEVTMNVCIGDEFDGGKLQFRGLRGTAEAGHLLGDFEPCLGTALLHAGRHLHEVTQVTSGHRYAYIIWARSWGGSRLQSCQCCWLNRRRGNECVCGSKWN